MRDILILGMFPFAFVVFAYSSPYDPTVNRIAGIVSLACLIGAGIVLYSYRGELNHE